ncbi:hypothetical protein H4R34_004022 [Dimargaris verticillata]|uniref:RNA helicase n=1 Tax=Dimargaris verticillata TaxID=2761393 RepID=A0A9W8B5R4_9FUNG|nr:hypothetical protein H4R34_004022 [Dimargaris verticillata]
MTLAEAGSAPRADKKQKKKNKQKDTKNKDKSQKRAHHELGDHNGSATEPIVAKKAKQATPTVSVVSQDDPVAYYKEHAISVDSTKAYLPWTQFGHSKFDENVMTACASFERPSPIQAACWPIIQDKRDVIGIAETGSGKTLAFAMPGLQHILTRGAPRRSCKPTMLVLSPTRELALQIEEQCTQAGKPCGVETVCVYGGSNKAAQQQILTRQKPQIIVATPGRLQDLIESEALDISDVSFLVLDEADRMLDIGFEQAIRSIISAIQHPTRQTVMFSATWPESIRKLANDFLRDPVRVTIGSDDLTVNQNVKQVVEVLEPDDKYFRLMKLLQDYHRSRTNRIIIFVLYKKEAENLERRLLGKKFKVAAIHGNKNQTQRIAALDSFKQGTAPLLVATDVAARGLDIPMVEYVINYTFPLTIDDYIHRIGRTGRAGNKGLSHTFFTEHDKAHSGELYNILKTANAEVPQKLLNFGTAVKKKEHKVYGAFFKDIDPNVKGTKIVFD